MEEAVAEVAAGAEAVVEAVPQDANLKFPIRVRQLNEVTPEG